MKRLRGSKENEQGTQTQGSNGNRVTHYFDLPKSQQAQFAGSQQGNEIREKVRATLSQK